jgi:phosphoserine aminotransferase
MTKRLYNFNPGPAALPIQVLEQAQEEFIDVNNQGISLMEMSHRGKFVERLTEETQQLLLDIVGLRSGYKVLFMGGGASTQFALIPMNFLAPDQVANYILSGSFSEKAYSEARFIGQVHIASSSKEQKWANVPAHHDLQLADHCAYVHMTTNNTIEGSRFNEFPDIGDIPLIGDMTSDILSRQLDYTKFAMIYAGAQKNLGPAGVTAVIIREDMLEHARKDIPVIMRYETFAKEKSLYNTPPVHSIYMMNLMLKWVVEQGGVAELEKRNAAKARLVYETIDASGGFYTGIVHKADRSDMNITWKLNNEELEQQFVKESIHNGFEGLSGHRSVGGLRASAYNAVPVDACEALVEFMVDFQRRNG